MALVKWSISAAMILVLAAPVALAGPNAGGVLVVHATTLAYTTDTASYGGLSGIACGQDRPFPPAQTECPPYDPTDGATPCVPEAANATSTMAAGAKHIWYVMAAFPNDSCPRLAALGFRIRYDPEKITIAENGIADPDPDNFSLGKPSTEDSSPFPSDRSGMALTFGETKTSRLQEVWWFAGYSVAGAVDPTLFAVEVLSQGVNPFFVDDSFPAKTDSIAGFGVLGLGGSTGINPTPQVVSPVEKTSWSRIKATYGPK